VISDFQASALSQVSISVPSLAVRPNQAPRSTAESGRSMWALSRGPLASGPWWRRLSWRASRPVPVTVAVGERVSRSALATGGRGAVSISGCRQGGTSFRWRSLPMSFGRRRTRRGAARGPASEGELHGLDRPCWRPVRSSLRAGASAGGGDRAFWSWSGASIVAPRQIPPGRCSQSRAGGAGAPPGDSARSSWQPASLTAGPLVGREPVGRRHELVASRPGEDAGDRDGRREAMGGRTGT